MKRIKLDLEAGREDEAAATLLALPADVRRTIAQYLSVQEIVNLSRVNQNLAAWLRQDRYIWKMIYNRNFGREMPIDRLVANLRVTFPNDDTDYTHGNYRTLLLAYASTTVTTRFSETVQYINIQKEQQINVSKEKQYLIVYQPNDTRYNSRLYRTQYAARKVINDLTTLFEINRIYTEGKYMSEEDYRFYFKVKYSPMIEKFYRFIVAFQLVKNGYEPFHTYLKDIPIRFCVECNSENVKFRLEPENHEFCSRKCATKFIEMRGARNDERAVFDFRGELEEWMRNPPRGYSANEMEFGDRYMEDAEYLLIQRSQDYDMEADEMISGFTIQVVGVREQNRRAGVATQIIAAVENTARDLGSRYVLIQSIMSEPMRELAVKLGYKVKKFSRRDYIKFL